MAKFSKPSLADILDKYPLRYWSTLVVGTDTMTLGG